MTTWQVHLAYDGDPIDTETAIAIGADLAGYEASVGTDNGALSVVMTMDSDDQAVSAACAVINEAEDVVRTVARTRGARGLGLLADARAVTWERAEAELDEPNYPDIVSAVEAADILGITRQRVHQLRTTHDDFPEPLYQLRTGPLWVRVGIEAFGQRWERRSGRPPARKSA